MISRLPGAIARAILMVLLITMPSVMLTGMATEGVTVVALVALCAAVFTAVEYLSSSPSLVEFRDAPPFNRLRFTALFCTVFALSTIFSSAENPTTLTRIFQEIGERIGASIDFPYSPVRLIVLMMPADTSPAVLECLRTAAGISYLVSLLTLAVFILLLRMRGWPRKTSAFNVWVNLPTFDPTTGGDVVARLNRDSQVNLILGFLLPFLIPAVIKFATGIVGPMNLDDPQTMIWVVTAWAFLPASLLMRGVALSRVAQMIYLKRKKAYARAAADGMLPVS